MPSGSAWMKTSAWGEGLADPGFHGIGNLVRAEQRKRAIHLDMDLDEGIDAGAAGPEIVAIQHLRVLQHDLPDAFPVRLGEFAVHQLLDRAPRDLVRGMDDDARDHDRDDRVGEPPSPTVIARASAAITPTLVRISEA